jgi:hypothetical protein
MVQFKVINRLQLRDGVLMCKKPSGRSWQKAHYKQGDLDGACGAYSISMVLNILGVFEADNLYSESNSEKVDNRKAEWKLINALNEQGLYRDGLDSSDIQEILSENYSKYVTTQCAIKKEHDLVELATAWLDKNNPVIIRISYDNNNSHWVVVVGYVVDDYNNVCALLTLDPGNDSPTYCLWNGILDLEKLPRKTYGYRYSAPRQTLVDMDEIVIITKK